MYPINKDKVEAERLRHVVRDYIERSHATKDALLHRFWDDLYTHIHSWCQCIFCREDD